VIQFVKLSDFNPVIVTASLSNADSLKALSATHVFDRHISANDLLVKINLLTIEPLKYVFDVVSSEQTENIGMSILSQDGNFDFDEDLARLRLHTRVKI
jgi:hypothetical protein